MKWLGQYIQDLPSRFRDTVDFSEDVTFYQPVNNADPQINIGASDDERLHIGVNYQGTTTQTAQIVSFKTYTESATAHDGRFVFNVDEANILKIQDAGIDLFTGMGISINGTDILTDSSGTATLSNIDALDATTVSTLNAALTAGDITGITAGTGLNGGGTSGAVTLNVDAAQTGITSLGNLTALQVDDINLNGKTIGIIGDTEDTFTIVTGGAGATTLTTTDDNAAAGHFEIAADGDIILDSAGQIKLEPVAGNNILLDGTIAIDAGVVTGVTSITSDAFVGDLTGAADTVATIAGLAPNTATTQATQPAIESIGTDGDTLTILSDQLLMSNTTNSAPTIKLVNTTDDDEGSQLIFEKLRDDDAVASGQNLGEIWFKGQDASQNTEDYAYIIGEIDVATHGQESGQLKLGLANHDGGNGNGLILTGGSENDEIDVTVGLGANSVVSVPGNIDLAGDIDVDGTLETDALTIGGAAVLAQATASAVGAVELATTAEADSGTDTTRAITAAGLKSHVDARYQYTYTSFIGISDIATNWAIPHANGWNAYANQWSIDTSVSATSIDTTISVTRAYTAVGFTVPHDGILVGFYATIRNNDNDNQPAVGLFHQSGATIWGLVSATNFALKAYAAASYAGGAGTNYKGPCKAIDLSRSLALTAGDVIIPAVLEASTDKVFCNITMVIKTLVP